MTSLGKLHTAAGRAIAQVRRGGTPDLADRADALMSIALIDYYKSDITEAQLAGFLAELAEGKTDAITLHYGHAAFRLPVLQPK